VQKDPAFDDIRRNVRVLPEINGILPKIKPTKTAGNQLKCIDCSRPNECFFFDVQTVSSAAVPFWGIGSFGVAYCLVSDYYGCVCALSKFLFLGRRAGFGTSFIYFNLNEIYFMHNRTHTDAVFLSG